MREDQYWQAVMTRDEGLDGVFVYGVRSTGVYCRPSCPSRRPKREQAVFFTRPEEAEEAGFRACKRCRPREASSREEQVALVRQLCAYIDEHLEQRLTLAELGEQVHLSPYHLQHVFKRVMGITPRQYAGARRMEQFKTRLKEGETVTTALFDAGYSSSSRLYERVPGQLGMTPVTYRKGGAGMHIRYTIVDSPLGRLLVAASERGICSVCLGDDDAPIEAALRREYNAADIQRDDAELSEEVNELLRYLRGQQPYLDLPVEVQATAFQWRVWQELRAIPYGGTRSYSEIARAIGRPQARRAVARACASNPAALVIPCHRVVREDGDPGGYRWGVERKRRLLAQEQERIKNVQEAQEALEHPVAR
ncbi:MAG TPA: bifunctional DNA-binding transcriptional regulator/O6-methylguanine-DNA methyltransferase Ada [Ktedonobacteraceae bacterium]|nr:bifunctional DNA-binding transcriptional regulator/O6-methylguanine-DNA methyltransferase Ada [Ktedonobacteraceae bacterium]